MYTIVANSSEFLEVKEREQSYNKSFLILNYMVDMFSIQRISEQQENNNVSITHITKWLAENSVGLDVDYNNQFDKQENKNGVISNFIGDKVVSNYFYSNGLLRLAFIRDDSGKGIARVYFDESGNPFLKTEISWNGKTYITSKFVIKFDGEVHEFSTEYALVTFFLDHVLGDATEFIAGNNQYTSLLLNYETSLDKMFLVEQQDIVNLNYLQKLQESSYGNAWILVATDEIKKVLVDDYLFNQTHVRKNELVNQLVTELATNRKITVGILTDGVSPKAGGLTGALYKRIKFLQQSNYDTRLFTFANQNSVHLYKQSVEANRAVDNPVYNLWDFMKKRSVFLPTEMMNNDVLSFLKTRVSTGSDASVYSEVKNNEKYMYYLDKNKTYKFQGFSEISSFLKETYVNNSLTTREYYNAEGIKVRQTTVDGRESEITESFYEQGKLMLTTGRRFDNNKKQYVKTWFELPNVSGKQHFKFYYQLQIYFMSKFLPKENDVLFVEHPAVYTAVSTWNTKKFINVVFHSTHLTYGTNNLKGAYDRVVDNLGKTVNRIIVLTSAAKKDLDTRVNNLLRSEIVIEPHTIEFKNVSQNFENKPELTAISLGRLDKDKRVADVIEAFKPVVNEFPDAQLIVYGEGPEAANLASLVKSLELEKNVQFKGFTNNIDEAFQKATVHVFASKFEGFGLTLLESLANGTPNIAYSVDYGPKEFVEKESLVDDGNVDMFSQKILDVFRNPNQKINRSKEAVAFASKYNDEYYDAQLKKLLATSIVK